MSHEMRQFLVIFKNQYFNDIDHEHFEPVLPKKTDTNYGAFSHARPTQHFHPQKSLGSKSGSDRFRGLLESGQASSTQFSRTWNSFTQSFS